MSRVFTIVVILLLMAVVALVPRIGTDEPGLDLGDGHAYREDTLARFRLLLEDDGWSLAEPLRNAEAQVELEAVFGHKRQFGLVQRSTRSDGSLMPARPALIQTPCREAGGVLAATPRAPEAVRSPSPEQDGLAGLLAVETALELEEGLGVGRFHDRQATWEE